MIDIDVDFTGYLLYQFTDPKINLGSPGARGESTMSLTVDANMGQHDESLRVVERDTIHIHRTTHHHHAHHGADTSATSFGQEDRPTAPQ